MTDAIGYLRATALTDATGRTNTAANAANTRGTDAAGRTASGSAASGTEADSQPGASPSALATKETFLTLLVAQIKNQNPLNPADGTEFLTQLAQFTQLEQLISIREELEAMGKQNQALAEAAASAAAGARNSAGTRDSQ